MQYGTESQQSTAEVATSTSLSLVAATSHVRLLVIRHIPLALAVVPALRNSSRLPDHEIRTGFSVTANGDHWHEEL